MQNTVQSTSHESAEASINLAANLRARIIALAELAGGDGLTISEAAEEICDHKNTSVSPRFSELVASGRLVRVLEGRGKPTKRSPAGVPRYTTRFDKQTKRNVTIHWLPGFQPGVKRPSQSVRPGG
jgi:hypothetical protein